MRRQLRLAVLIAVFCGMTTISEAVTGGFTVASPVFRDNGAIPKEFTCQGDDINPPLTIENVPPGAKSLALVVEDPDAPAGVWSHWVMWNISAGARGIGENSVPAGAMQGKNDWGTRNYRGPCPPNGTHRYFFTVYALDSRIDLPGASGRNELEKAMKGHLLGRAALVGFYRKQ